MKITSSDYYSLTPPNDHEPGDIWSGLPTHGLLRRNNVHGLVITPACDLGNFKVETLTYLPIISVHEFIRAISAVRPVKSELMRQLTALTMPTPDWPEDTTLPSIMELGACLAAVDNLEANVSKSQTLQRCRTAARCLINIKENAIDLITKSDLELILTKARLKRTTDDIITNARPETHFLPRDNEPDAYSGVPLHSAVLFRYPLTAPIEILDMAGRIRGARWSMAMKELSATVPMAASFKPQQPVKRSRLLNPFLSDLISRYTATYSRLGSPDFSSATVQQFSEEVA